jgi:hypothetical protein
MLAGALSLAGLAQAAVDPDPVVLTFSTVGDSRQDPVTFDATIPSLNGQDAHWLQNTKAWSRILKTVQSQKASLLFFNGDMIHGYGWAGFGYTTDKTSTTINGVTTGYAPVAPTDVSGIVNSDLVKFYTQYAYWRGMVAPVIESGTYIVPVPGNHEVQCKVCGKKTKIENENAWRANMGDLIIDSARFTATVGTAASAVNVGNNGAADGFGTDQSQLSYSFDVGTSHFAVINTDPANADGKPPTKWLLSDLSNAKSRGAKSLFVFGHKPYKPYVYAAGAAPSGMASGANTTDFWALIDSFGATYFCGHEHIFNMSQPAGVTTSTLKSTPLTSPGTAWQVIVGAGGSPFDSALGASSYNPATDRTYSWATVAVHKSGKADITAYGFSDAYGPTHVLQSVTVPAAPTAP